MMIFFFQIFYVRSIYIFGFPYDVLPWVLLVCHLLLLLLLLFICVVRRIGIIESCSCQLNWCATRKNSVIVRAYTFLVVYFRFRFFFHEKSMKLKKKCRSWTGLEALKELQSLPVPLSNDIPLELFVIRKKRRISNALGILVKICQSQQQYLAKLTNIRQISSAKFGEN